MYSVDEDGGQGFNVCAVVNGSAEIFPRVGFTTNTMGNNSGEILTKYSCS